MGVWLHELAIKAESSHQQHGTLLQGGWEALLQTGAGRGTPGRWVGINPTSGEEVDTGVDLGPSLRVAADTAPLSLPALRGRVGNGG